MRVAMNITWYARCAHAPGITIRTIDWSAPVVLINVVWSVPYFLLRYNLVPDMVANTSGKNPTRKYLATTLNILYIVTLFWVRSALYTFYY